jgi:UMF1 family MFS transporter
MFLLAYWLYIDGVDTIVRMAVDYGMTLGFDSSALIIALLMVQFVAFPAALVYSWFASKIGLKRAIMMGIVGYGVITFLGFLMTKEIHFYALAVMIGLFQGGIQALSRSLYTRIIPKEKSAEFFGFYNMLGKFAAVIGPMMMGTIALWTGNIRIGILSILILFILGGYFLTKVNIEEGEKLAKDFLAK